MFIDDIDKKLSELLLKHEESMRNYTEIIEAPSETAMTDVHVQRLQVIDTVAKQCLNSQFNVARN